VVDRGTRVAEEATSSYYFSSQQIAFLASNASILEANYMLTQPVLLLNGRNFITGTAGFPNQKEAFAPGLHVKNMDGGHWITLERAQETNPAL
jgi:hypothetical protein